MCIPLSVQKLVVHVHQGSTPDCGSNDSPKHLLQVEPTGDAATHIHPHAHTRHVHRGAAESSSFVRLVYITQEWRRSQVTKKLRAPGL